MKWTGKMIHLVKQLPHKCGGLGSNSTLFHNKLGMAVPTYNPVAEKVRKKAFSALWTAVPFEMVSSRSVADSVLKRKVEQSGERYLMLTSDLHTHTPAHIFSHTLTRTRTHTRKTTQENY